MTCLARSFRRKPLCVLVQVCLTSIFAASVTHAAVTGCVVNTTLDDASTASGTVIATTNSGTLRDCLLAANLTTGSTGKPTLPGTTITFDPAMSGATISLNNDLPLLFNNTTIDASALANPVSIDGGSAHRIFFVSGLPSTTTGLVNGKPDPDGSQATTVILRNLKLQNGRASGGAAAGFGGGGMGAGGALFVNKSASVTLSGTSFLGDVAQGGSGVNFSAASGGGGMGIGTSFYGGGGGLGSITAAFNGAGIGTYGTTGGATGGWGGQGLGQLSSVQGFNPASFDVDSGSGTSGLGLIGGGGGVATGGGFGGGGGSSGNLGGSGGFGGGGGAIGGGGGFGGGGGSAVNTSGGIGGFGGGGGLSISGTSLGGGVGAGLGSGSGFGGAVFVRAGGNLTVQNLGVSASIAGGSVIAGHTNATINGGVAAMAAAAGSGMFLMSTATTTFDIASRYSISDTLADDSLSTLPAGQTYTAGNGAGAAITKQGTGSLVLSGANTYHGATAVNAGILRVTSPGKIDKSITTVAATGTLTGDGTAGPIVSFGTLAPGTAIDPQGTLAVSGALQVQLGALTCFHADATNAISDLNITGNATLNGIARIDFSGGPTAGTIYYPLSAGNVSGTFSGYETNMPNLIGHFSYTGSQVAFTVDASDVLFRNSFEQSTGDSPCIAAFAN